MPDMTIIVALFAAHLTTSCFMLSFSSLLAPTSPVIAVHAYAGELTGGAAAPHGQWPVPPSDHFPSGCALPENCPFLDVFYEDTVLNICSFTACGASLFDEFGRKSPQLIRLNKAFEQFEAGRQSRVSSCMESSKYHFNYSSPVDSSSGGAEETYYFNCFYKSKCYPNEKTDAADWLFSLYQHQHPDDEYFPNGSCASFFQCAQANTTAQQSFEICETNNNPEKSGGNDNDALCNVTGYCQGAKRAYVTATDMPSYVPPTPPPAPVLDYIELAVFIVFVISFVFILAFCGYLLYQRRAYHREYQRFLEQGMFESLLWEGASNAESNSSSSGEGEDSRFPQVPIFDTTMIQTNLQKSPNNSDDDDEAIGAAQSSTDESFNIQVGGLHVGSSSSSSSNSSESVWGRSTAAAVPALSSQHTNQDQQSDDHFPVPSNKKTTNVNTSTNITNIVPSHQIASTATSNIGKQSLSTRCVLCGKDTTRPGAQRYLLLPCRCEWCGCNNNTTKRDSTNDADVQALLHKLTSGGTHGRDAKNGNGNSSSSKGTGMLSRISRFLTRTSSSSSSNGEVKKELEPAPFEEFPTPVDLLKYTLATLPDVVPLELPVSGMTTSQRRQQQQLQHRNADRPGVRAAAGVDDDSGISEGDHQHHHHHEHDIAQRSDTSTEYEISASMTDSTTSSRNHHDGERGGGDRGGVEDGGSTATLMAPGREDNSNPPEGPPERGGDREEQGGNSNSEGPPVIPSITIPMNTINTCACHCCQEPLQAVVNISELFLDLEGDGMAASSSSSGIHSFSFGSSRSLVALGGADSARLSAGLSDRRTSSAADIVQLQHCTSRSSSLLPVADDVGGAAPLSSRQSASSTSSSSGIHLEGRKITKHPSGLQKDDTDDENEENEDAHLCFNGGNLDGNHTEGDEENELVDGHQTATSLIPGSNEETVASAGALALSPKDAATLSLPPSENISKNTDTLTPESAARQAADSDSSQDILNPEGESAQEATTLPVPPSISSTTIDDAAVTPSQRPPASKKKRTRRSAPHVPARKLKLPPAPECCICWSNPACVSMLGCGHLIVCRDCAEDLRTPVTRTNDVTNVEETSATCPVCRSDIRAMVVLETDQVNSAIQAALYRRPSRSS